MACVHTENYMCLYTDKYLKVNKVCIENLSKVTADVWVLLYNYLSLHSMYLLILSIHRMLTTFIFTLVYLLHLFTLLRFLVPGYITVCCQVWNEYTLMKTMLLWKDFMCLLMIQSFCRP